MKRSIVLAGVLAATIVIAGAASSSGRGTTTTRFFIRDSVQATIDLGDKGPSNGDLFTYHGKVFTRKDGPVIGAFGGTCTTLAAAPGLPEDSDCNVDYILPKGRLMTNIMGSSEGLFSGRPVVFAILGGTGAYRDARGDGTVAVPPDVPNQTDAFVVLHLR